MATFSINISEYINLPPSNIDDYSIDIDNRETLTLTSSMFTNGYSDPENDDPYSIKILSLPDYGTLKFNGSDVIVNQEILFSDIDAGLFTFEAPDIDAAVSTSFNFSISDTGSKQFIE